MKLIKMKKIVFPILFFIVIAINNNLHAQVTIGTDTPPHKDALLELKENTDGSSSKGLLFPRVKLSSTNTSAPLSSHVEGMTVYNTATASSGATYVSPGLYYNDGIQWVRMPMSATNWFYMPSISFDSSTTLSGQKKNLYQEYYNQFTGASGHFVKSNSAPKIIPYLPKATDLYYYITDYDPNVFSNISIDDNGIMVYDVTAAATDASFINIVFVLK